MVLALVFAGMACTPEENGGNGGNKENQENKENEKPQPVLVTGITLDGTSLSVLVGESATLAATVAPGNADNKKIAWSSSDESVAKVDANGVVKAVAKGKADIVASSSDGSSVTAKCAVVVSNPCPEGAIDLGLTNPDGFRFYFATSNLSMKGLCADPMEPGDYFAWGETEPYYISQNPLVWKEGKSQGYMWPSYKWFIDYTSTHEAILSKYCWKKLPDLWGGSGEPDGKTVLDPEDDAAHIILGGNWRIPTNQEFTILKETCECRMAEENGIKGMRVNAPNGKSYFFAASGRLYGDEYLDPRSDVHYWTADLSTGTQMASSFAANSSAISTKTFTTRFMGLAIRPVSD